MFQSKGNVKSIGNKKSWSQRGFHLHLVSRKEDRLMQRPLICTVYVCSRYQIPGHTSYSGKVHGGKLQVGEFTSVQKQKNHLDRFNFNNRLQSLNQMSVLNLTSAKCCLNCTIEMGSEWSLVNQPRQAAKVAGC